MKNAARDRINRLLSVLCAGAIMFGIISSGISVRVAYTADADCLCGMFEHAHSSACYEISVVCERETHRHGATCLDEEGTLICSQDEHTHSADCETKTLICAQIEHSHTAGCYAKTDFDLNETETQENNAPAMLSTASDGDGQGSENGPVSPSESLETLTETQTTEPETKPIATPTVEQTTEPTEDPGVNPAPDLTTAPTIEMTPEQTEVLDVSPTPELTVNPTTEPTAVSTEEPAPIPLVLEDLYCEQESAMPGEAVTWRFVCEGAEELYYIICGADGATLEEGRLGEERSVEWTPAASGSYTLTVIARNSQAEMQASHTVAVRAALLEASVFAATRSAFAGIDTIEYETAIQGGVGPYEATYRITAGGKTIFEASGFQEKFAYAPQEFGEHTLTMYVRDSEGATAEASCTVPVAVNERESESDWRRSVAGVDLSGNWAVDIVAIAQTQVGYQESDRNFIIDEDGDVQGYTRYGDAYGLPYEEWCAMFVCFCADYAEIPEQYLPRHAGCARIADALGKAYIDDEDDYAPQAGDLIFFHHNRTEDQRQESAEERNTPNHIGIVTGADERYVYTIEGNSGGAVREHRYALNDESIVGYASMAALMERAGVATPEGGEQADAPSDGTTGPENQTNARIVILKDSVNLREGPSTQSALVDRVNQGTELALLETVKSDGETWYKARYLEREVYVRSDLAELVEEEAARFTAMEYTGELPQGVYALGSGLYEYAGIEGSVRLLAYGSIMGGESAFYLCDENGTLLSEEAFAIPAVDESEVPAEPMAIAIWIDPETFDLGQEVRLVAEVEPGETRLQWQRSLDAFEWEDIPGAEEAVYALIADEENTRYYYRILQIAPESGSGEGASAEEGILTALAGFLFPVANAEENAMEESGTEDAIVGIGQTAAPLSAGLRAAGALTVTASSDMAQYTAGDTVMLTVSVQNTGRDIGDKKTVTISLSDSIAEGISGLSVISATATNNISLTSSVSGSTITITTGGNVRKNTITVVCSYVIPESTAVGAHTISANAEYQHDKNNLDTGTASCAYTVEALTGWRITGMEGPQSVLDYGETATFTLSVGNYDATEHTMATLRVYDANDALVFESVELNVTIPPNGTATVSCGFAAPASGHGAQSYRFELTDTAGVSREIAGEIELQPEAGLELAEGTVQIAEGENPVFTQIRARVSENLDTQKDAQKKNWGSLERRNEGGTWETIYDFEKVNIEGENYYHDFLTATMTLDEMLKTRYRFTVYRANADRANQGGIAYDPPQESKWFYLTDLLPEAGFREWVLNPENGYVDAAGEYTQYLGALDDLAEAYQVYIRRGLSVAVNDTNAQAGEDASAQVTIASDKDMRAGGVLTIALADTGNYAVGGIALPMESATSDFGTAEIDPATGTIKLTLSRAVPAGDEVELNLGRWLPYDTALGVHPIRAHATYAESGAVKQETWDGNGGAACTQTDGSITVAAATGWHIVGLEQPQTALATGDTASFVIDVSNFDGQATALIGLSARLADGTALAILAPENADGALSNAVALDALTTDESGLQTPGKAMIPVTVVIPETLTTGEYEVTFALTDAAEPAASDSIAGNLSVIAPTLTIVPDVTYDTLAAQYVIRLVCKDLTGSGGTHALEWYMRDVSQDEYANWQGIATDSTTADEAAHTLSGDVLAALEALEDSGNMQFRLKDAVSGAEYLSNTTVFENLQDMKDAALLMSEMAEALGMTYSVWMKLLDHLYYDEVAKDSGVPFSDKSTLMLYLLDQYTAGGIDGALSAWRQYRYDLYDPNLENADFNPKGTRDGGEFHGDVLYTDVDDEYDFADDDLKWTKDYSGSPFHAVQQSKINGMDEFLQDGALYSGSYFENLEKTAAANANGDSNENREYTIDLKADAEGIISVPTIVVFQIQTSWQMFDLDHANGVNGPKGAPCTVDEMATLYDIKHALIDFAEWLRTNGDGSVVFAITNVQHTTTHTMISSPYFTNDADTLIAGLRAWDIFGDCEHVHYSEDMFVNAVDAITSTNFSQWVDANGNSIFESAKKVAVVIGGSTENTNGDNGYGAKIPELNNVDYLYTIRTTSGTAHPYLSWLDNSANEARVERYDGIAFKDKTTRAQLVQTFKDILQDIGSKGNNPAATNVVVTDTIQDEFAYKPGTARIVTLNEQGQEVETPIADAELTIMPHADGTTTICYTFAEVAYHSSIHLRFEVQAKADYIGSNNVLTNVGKATLEYSTDLHGAARDVQRFSEEPQVNVPIRYTIENGGETTVNVGDTVNLWDLDADEIVGNPLGTAADGIEDWSVRYDQINGTVTYQWVQVALDEQGNVVSDANGRPVPVVGGFSTEPSAPVQVTDGVVAEGGFPDLAGEFVPTAAGDYTFALLTTFTPDPKGDWTEVNDGAVSALTKYGLVTVHAKIVALTIVKSDSTDHGKRLEGAEFTIYSDADCTQTVPVYTDEGMTGEPVTAFATGAGGSVTLYGLAAGNYYLKESKAPEGYLPIDAALAISIQPDGTVTTEASQSVRIEAREAAEGGWEIYVYDSPVYILTTTGGRGTGVFLASGMVLMCLAGAMLLHRKRRRVVKE